MTTQQFYKKKLFSEVLEYAQNSGDPLASLQHDIANDPRLSYILGYAINPEFNISSQIPTGTPPYTPSEHPLELATLDPLKVSKDLYIIFNANMKKIKKEEFYIKWIEMMHPTDVELMGLVKDQILETKYNKLTKVLIAEALGWTPIGIREMFKEQK